MESPFLSFFDTGRNEPCPCGSERKFKRCCQDRVTTARRALQARLGIRLTGAGSSADFLGGLALACALPPDPDLGEAPADLEAVAGAVDDLFDALNEEDTSTLSEIQATLHRLLAEDRFLREMRFWPLEAEEALAAVEALAPADPADEEALEPCLDAALRRLVTPDFADDLAWELMSALRRPDRDPQALRALAWGLLCAVTTFRDRLGDNPLWKSVLVLTLADLEAFRKVVGGRDASPEGPRDEHPRLDMDALARCLEEHPIIDRMLSRDQARRVAPAMEALRAGRLDLSVPPYALAFTLRDAALRLAPLLPELSRRAAADPSEAARWLGGTIEEVLGFEGWMALARTAWEHDHPHLVPAVQEALERWREQADETIPAELAEAVSGLAGTFGEGLTRGGWHTFRSIVWLLLPRLQAITLFLSPEAGERYASELAAAGLAEAAGHVRAALAWGGSGGGEGPRPAPAT